MVRWYVMGLDRAEEFLDLFKTLEGHLRRTAERSSWSEHSYESFSSLVRRAAQSDVVVRHYQYDLRRYGDLRNILVHERGRNDRVIAVPTKETLEHFRRIVSEIVSPPTLERFVRQIRPFTPDDPLREVLAYMGKHDYSQVVVRVGDNIGLLTVEGVARWLARRVGEGIVAMDATVRDILTLEDPNTFVILSRKHTLYDAVEVFSSSLRHGRPRVYAVVITASGRAREHPLGIVTPWDLLDVLAPERNGR